MHGGVGVWRGLKKPGRPAGFIMVKSEREKINTESGKEQTTQESLHRANWWQNLGTFNKWGQIYTLGAAVIHWLDIFRKRKRWERRFKFCNLPLLPSQKQAVNILTAYQDYWRRKTSRSLFECGPAHNWIKRPGCVRIMRSSRSSYVARSQLLLQQSLYRESVGWHLRAGLWTTFQFAPLSDLDRLSWVWL